MGLLHCRKCGFKGLPDIEEKFSFNNIVEREICPECGERMRIEGSTFLALILVPLLVMIAAGIPKAGDCPDVSTGWSVLDYEKVPDCVAEAERQAPMLTLVGVLLLLDICILFAIAYNHDVEKRSYGWRPLGEQEKPYRRIKKYPGNYQDTSEPDIDFYLRKMKAVRAEINKKSGSDLHPANARIMEKKHQRELSELEEKISQLQHQVKVEKDKSKNTTIIVQDSVVVGDVIGGDKINDEDN